MPEPPSQLWKQMPLAKRTEAAEAFWRDKESPEVEAQHVEAVVVLARRLNFRPRSLQGLPVERRAKYLAQLPDVSDAIATRALVAYHFTAKRPLMAAFLDALGVAHTDGLITEEDIAAPRVEPLAAAVATVRATFDQDDVDLYLRTLAALDGTTWANLDSVIEPAR